MTKRVGVLAVLLLVSGLWPASRADAGVIISINQVGSDVVATGSGSYNLTGATFLGVGAQDGFIGGGSGGLAVGGPFGNVDAYQLTSNPGPVSTGPFVNGSPDVGNLFGLDTAFAGGFITVPQGYLSGASLSGSTTFSGQNYTSLGLTPGTYVYSIPNDTLTIQVNAVPEPVSLLVFGGLIVGGGLVARKRLAKKVVA